MEHVLKPVFIHQLCNTLQKKINFIFYPRICPLNSGFPLPKIKFFHTSLFLSILFCQSIVKSPPPYPIIPSIHPSSDLPFIFLLVPILEYSLEICFPEFFSHIKPL